MSLLFQEPTKEELEKRKKEHEDIEKRIKVIAKLGNECLSENKFQKYKTEFEKCKEKLLDFMIAYADPEPIKDAFFLRSALGQMKILKMFIDMINKDVRRGKKK